MSFRANFHGEWIMYQYEQPSQEVDVIAPEPIPADPDFCWYELAVDDVTVVLTTDKFWVESLSVTYDGKELVFSEAINPDAGADPETSIGDHTYQPEQDVTLRLFLRGAWSTEFSGKIKQATPVAENADEHVQYNCLGKMKIAAGCDLMGDIGPGDAFDAPGGSFLGVTVARAVQEIFDNNAVYLATQNVPATIGTPNLDNLESIIDEDVTYDNTGFVETLQDLVSYHPTARAFFDDATQSWVFPDILRAASIEIDIDQFELPRLEYSIDNQNRFTAIKLWGEYTITVVSNLTIPLIKGWDVGNEGLWTIGAATFVLQAGGDPKAGFPAVYRYWKFGVAAPQPQGDTKVYLEVLATAFWKLGSMWVNVQMADGQPDFEAQDVLSDWPVIIAGNWNIARNAPKQGDAAIGPLDARLVYATPISFTGIRTVRWPPGEGTWEGTAFDLYGLEKMRQIWVDPAQLHQPHAREQLEMIKNTIVECTVTLTGMPLLELMNLGKRILITHPTNDVGVLAAEPQLYLEYTYNFRRPVGENVLRLTTDRQHVTRRL